jgi:peptidyl-prolyl cis-trans isomerase D
MLQSIRDRAQGWMAWLIVGILIVPFALWGVNEYATPSTEVTVAEIGGTEIMQQQLEFAYQRQLKRMQVTMRGQDFSAMEKILKEQTLQQMINEEVLLHNVLDQGFRVGDTMLAVRIHAFPSFQENGKFSDALYRLVLSQQGLTPTGFEEDMRRALISDQYEQGIVRSAFITDADKQASSRLNQQQRLVSYLTISPDRFKDQITVSEQEQADYFKAHQNDYVTPEQVSVEYVELAPEQLGQQEEAVEEAVLRQRYDEQIASYTTEPEWKASHILIETGADEAAAKKKADELYERAKSGEAFDALAKEFSNDKGSAANGGDLGTFSRGQMVKPFEEAVEKLQPGEISAPVKSQFGYHVIKLAEVKPGHTKPFEEVREEILKAYRHEQAESKFYSLVENFANLAYENPDNLDTLASSMKLEKKTSPLFDRGGVAEGIFNNPKVISVAFSDQVLDQKQNSEVINLDNNHMVVLRIKDHQPSKPQAFEEVKDKVDQNLKIAKGKEAAVALAKTLLDELKQQPDRDAAAKKHELAWEAPQWVKRQASGLKPPQVASAAFKLGRPAAEGEALYKTLELSDGSQAVIALLAVKDGESSTTANGSEGRGESEFQMAMASLKNRTEIKVHKEKLD